MAKYPRDIQPQDRFDAREHVALVGNVTDPVHKHAGGLDKEDIVILVLSAILVIATIWIGTTVL